MSVSGVIFDWGGTLTPWHIIDPDELWRFICSPHCDPADLARITAALRAAEDELWGRSGAGQRSATLDEVFARARVTSTPAWLQTYYSAWDQHTITDAEAIGVLTALRGRGIRIGVLSNTMWPRAEHERIFRRDGLLDLIDGAVYSSEIPWTKPHPEAFRAAMAAIGLDQPGQCVFVGDRPYDDMHGAHDAGLRTVLIPNSDVPGYDVVPDAVIKRLADLPAVIEDW